MGMKLVLFLLLLVAKSKDRLKSIFLLDSKDALTWLTYSLCFSIAHIKSWSIERSYDLSADCRLVIPFRANSLTSLAESALRDFFLIDLPFWKIVL